MTRKFPCVISLNLCNNSILSYSVVIHLGVAITLVIVVQSLSCVQLFVTPWTATNQASLSFTLFWSLLKLMSIESMMPSNHLILSHPLLLLPSIFPSIRVFSSESALHIMWPQYWSFSFSISPFSLTTIGKHQVFDTRLIHGPTLTSVHDYWKNHSFDYTDLCWQSEVMSLIFNMLSRLVIAFLSRSKCLLILWLQSPSPVVLEAKKRKFVIVYAFFPIYLPWSDGTRCHDLSFLMLSFKPAFSLSSFTFIKRLFSSSSLSVIRVVSFAYLRLLTFPLALVIPAFKSSSPAFHMMYSAYKLNKPGDNIHLWCTPFSILIEFVFMCLILTVASCSAYRFLRRQVSWSGIPNSLRLFHNILWSTQSKALMWSVKYK